MTPPPERAPRGPARTLLRLALAGLVLLNLAFVAVWVLGSRVPEAHRVTLERSYQAPRDEVWRRVRAFGESAAWRSDTSAIELVSDGEHEVWEATTSFGPLRFAVELDEPPTRLITRIVDNDDFGGTWTYALEDAGEGLTRLTVTEDGVVPAVMFRFFGRYVFGFDATLRLFLDDLERELGASRG